MCVDLTDVILISFSWQRGLSNLSLVPFFKVHDPTPCFLFIEWFSDEENLMTMKKIDPFVLIYLLFHVLF